MLVNMVSDLTIPTSCVLDESIHVSQRRKYNLLLLSQLPFQSHPEKILYQR